MTRYKLTVTIDVERELTNEEIRMGHEMLLNEFPSDGIMPAGKVVEVSIAKDEPQ